MKWYPLISYTFGIINLNKTNRTYDEELNFDNESEKEEKLMNCDVTNRKK
jgi:hypothetical protein